MTSTETPPQTGTLRVELPTGAWEIPDAARKLALRAALPGAYGYDRAAHGFRAAQNRGTSPLALLPAAMPASWMVNNRAASPLFKRWLAPELEELWAFLLEACAGGPEVWLAHPEELRAQVGEVVAAMSAEEHSSCALSKVLALLVPETVPLLDDAAIHHLIGGLEPPFDAKITRAGPELFVPSLDAFCRAVLSVEQELIALARGHREAVLDAAQVLDRLLWVDSYGHALFQGRFVRADARAEGGSLRVALVAPAAPEASGDGGRGGPDRE